MLLLLNALIPFNNILIFQYSHVVERVDSVDSVERVVDDNA